MTSGATTSFRTFDLDPEASAQWDTMVGGAEVHLSARWLRSVEGNLIKTPLYVVRQGTDGKIKASAVGYLMEDSHDGSTDSLIRLTRIDSLLGVTGDDACAQHESSRRRRWLSAPAAQPVVRRMDTDEFKHALKQCTYLHGAGEGPIGDPWRAYRGRQRRGCAVPKFPLRGGTERGIARIVAAGRIP